MSRRDVQHQAWIVLRDESLAALHLLAAAVDCYRRATAAELPDGFGNEVTAAIATELTGRWQGRLLSGVCRVSFGDGEAAD